MTIIQLTDRDLDSNADSLKGQLLDEAHYDRCVRDSTTVLKPDGTPLLIYVSDVLPRALCEIAFATFKDVTLSSANREIGGRRSRPLKQDGTRSGTAQTPPTRGGIVGYYDRTPRMPFCRKTAFNLDHHRKFERARPFVVAASRTFQTFAPDRWRAQRSFIDGFASQDFVIRGSVFTTMTVNKTVRTRAHRDQGDYRHGLGVMAALEGGRYGGGELIFPKFRTAVDMRTGGLCLADVHELHGNAPIVGREGRFTRLSFVFYVRERMAECGTAVEEHAYALAEEERQLNAAWLRFKKAAAYADKTRVWADKAVARANRLIAAASANRL